jgi:hypothetical protein
MLLLPLTVMATRVSLFRPSNPLRHSGRLTLGNSLWENREKGPKKDDFATKRQTTFAKYA